MEYKIDFSGRAHAYMGEEVQAVVQAMNEAIPLTQGAYLAQFEADFRQYTGAPFAFAVSNATAGLELAAQLCLFQDGEELVAPSHTFTASVYPFLKKGAKVVWADIASETRVVTAETLERCITPKTKALLVVHLYGYGADMPAIMELAEKHNLLVIEDTAQAAGVMIDGQMAGTFGDFGVFSFHSHKNITTLGEGGMLSVKNEKYAKLIRLLRHNGHCGFDYERPDYWIPAMGNVDLPELDGIPLMPNNYCIGEVECALGSKLLKRLDQMNEEKRNRALWFMDQLSDFQELKFHRVDSSRHNYHLLVAEVLDGKRDQLIRDLAEKKGIKCVVQYCPLNRYPLYQKLGFGKADCPNADRFFDNMISFPFHHWMSDENLSYLAYSTQEVLGSLRE